MDKEEFIEYCRIYVKNSNFIPASRSIPEARKKDLAKLTAMAENMNPNVFAGIPPEAVGVICSAYYLGKKNP